jgi:hypothetical protein
MVSAAVVQSERIETPSAPRVQVREGRNRRVFGEEREPKVRDSSGLDRPILSRWVWLDLALRMDT